MQAMIDRVRPRDACPSSLTSRFRTTAITGIPSYDASIDGLSATNHLLVGPDLYAYFMAHPDELMADKLHPNDAGQTAINKLWADAVRPILIYPLETETMLTSLTPLVLAPL